jgi:hypothetical protein
MAPQSGHNHIKHAHNKDNHNDHHHNMRTALWKCSQLRHSVHYDSFLLGGKCVSTYMTSLYHDIMVYQLFFVRKVSASVTSCSLMGMISVKIARSGPFIASTEQRKWRVQW